MDLNSIKVFDGAVAKVTKDVKLLEYMPAEVKNCNSFPEEIHIPHVL